VRGAADSGHAELAALLAGEEAAELGGAGCTAFSTAADDQRGGGSGGGSRGGSEGGGSGGAGSVRGSRSGEEAHEAYTSPRGGGRSYTTHVWVSPVAGVPEQLDAFCSLVRVRVGVRVRVSGVRVRVSLTLTLSPTRAFTPRAA